MTLFLFILLISLISPQQTYAYGDYKIASQQVGNSRLAGVTCYETSAQIAQSGWITSDYAILASGENFPDALCAAPLASMYSAPILLTSRDHLEDSTKSELIRLKVKKLIIIGGDAVVSANVQQAITDLGIGVSRIAGNDLYDTSLCVAQRLGKSEEAVIASGSDFQDVLSISPIAAQKGIPIILTPKDYLKSDIKDYINKSFTKTIVLGDDRYVSDAVVNQLPSPQRISADDHYSLNIKIINTFVKDLDLSTCYVATGEGYPDALSGSALASLTKSPVILVKEPINEETMNFFRENSSRVQKVIAIGGTAVVPDNLLDSITPVSGVDNDGIISTPSHVEATTVDTDEIDLSWDSVNNAISYNVYRTTADSGVYNLIASVNRPYYIDQSVSAGVTYFYKIQAAGTNGTGPYSNAVAATALLDASDLTPPTYFVATSQDPSQILLNWNVVKNANYYNINRASSFNGTYTKIASVGVLYYSDSGLSPGKMYYYKVQAVNDKGPSNFSEITYAISK